MSLASVAASTSERRSAPRAKGATLPQVLRLTVLMLLALVCVGVAGWSKAAHVAPDPSQSAQPR